MLIRVGGAVQPTCVDWLMPNDSATNASGPRITPSVSSAPGARPAAMLGSARKPRNNASAPIGTLIKKMSRQSANWIR